MQRGTGSTGSSVEPGGLALLPHATVVRVLDAAGAADSAAVGLRAAADRVAALAGLAAAPSES